MPETETELAHAEETEQYNVMLTRYLDELTVIYENLMSQVLRGRSNEEITNAFIAKGVSIITHLLPKLEGGGIKTKSLLADFESFKPWMNDISLPKRDETEAERVPELFYLIIRAYNLLGLSNY